MCLRKFDIQLARMVHSALLLRPPRSVRVGDTMNLRRRCFTHGRMSLHTTYQSYRTAANSTLNLFLICIRDRRPKPECSPTTTMTITLRQADTGTGTRATTFDHALSFTLKYPCLTRVPLSIPREYTTWRWAIGQVTRVLFKDTVS